MSTEGQLKELKTFRWGRVCVQVLERPMYGERTDSLCLVSGGQREAWDKKTEGRKITLTS